MKKFNIHDWQAKQRKQRLTEETTLDDYSLEPEDMDNPDEDLVIIGSGYLDIKSNFGERPSQTNGEYAALGQKVVDQLHKGDKDAALDYIYKKINEMNTTGTGASFNAGAGEGYMTPNAFSKKNKKV